MDKPEKKKMNLWKRFWHSNTFKGARRALIISLAFLIAGLIATVVVNHFVPDLTIGTSIVRDINIMLISTTATLLGLYVTAFIFLNDSLKNRSKEDAMIKEAVNDILARYRVNMVWIAVGTIATIIFEVICNVILGAPQADKSIEDMRLALNGGIWYLFIVATVCSVFIVTWIIMASREITNSDRLISDHSFINLKKHHKALIDIFVPLQGSAHADYLLRKQAPSRDFAGMSSEELLQEFAKKEYDFELAFNSLRTGGDVDRYIAFADGFLTDDESTRKDRSSYLATTLVFEAVSKKKRKQKEKLESGVKTEDGQPLDRLTTGEYIIRLGKVTRFIESIVSRICDNNIDKSITNGTMLSESMRSGFHFLYAQDAREHVLDVRDEKRFLDHLKYQLITDKRFESLPFDNREVESAFDRARSEFNGLNYENKSNAAEQSFLRAVVDYEIPQVCKKDYIDQYKASMRKIIDEFFLGYKELIGYRDALIHYNQYDSRAKQKKRKQIKPDEKQYIGIAEQCIYVYAQVLKRVIIDRFTSFVKTDDLNLGNSTLDKGWFNYSELSKSNFTHSSFRFARIENAILRDCDLSTCSFIMADASDTDFSDSNFSYSDLTGIDLKNSNLNKAQMNSVILRDIRIENYDYGLKTLLRVLGSDNPALAKVASRRAWLTELRKAVIGGARVSSVEAEKLYDKAVAALREGDVIRDDLVGAFSGRLAGASQVLGALHGSCRLAKGDIDPNINTESGCVLETSYSLLFDEKTGLLKDFINYRRHSKIDTEVYAAIRDARIQEGRQEKSRQGKDDISNKATREKLFGKIYFGIATLEAASVNEVAMRDIDFSHVCISEASFRDSDLSNAEMYYTSARAAMFDKTNLNDLDAFESDFEGSNFKEASLVRATLTDCNFHGCNFSKSLLLNTLIVSTRKLWAHDSDALESRIYLKRYLTKKHEHHSQVQTMLELVEDEDASIDLEKNHGRPLHITQCDEGNNFVECEFVEAIANGLIVLNGNMMRSNFTKMSARGALFYNSLLRWGNLLKANFSNSMFIGVSFHQSDCKETQFSRARFFACEFSNANLSQANFISSALEKVIFDETNLQGSKLSSAFIRNCTFKKCNFDGVVVDNNTRFINCVFSKADLSKVIGLEEAKFVNCVFETNEADGACSEDEIKLSDPLERGDVEIVKVSGSLNDVSRYSRNE